MQLRDYASKEQIGDPGHRFARLDPRERTFLLQHRALGPGQTAAAFRELLDQASQRGSHLRGKAGKIQRLERARIRRGDRRPGRAGLTAVVVAPCRQERREVALLRHGLLRDHRGSVDQHEMVEQGELTGQVRLEPQDALVGRRLQRRIPCLELRVHFRNRAGAVLLQPSGTRQPELGCRRLASHWTLVQHVGPGDHLAWQACGAQDGERMVAVRDVQHARRVPRPPLRGRTASSDMA